MTQSSPSRSPIVKGPMLFFIGPIEMEFRKLIWNWSIPFVSFVMALDHASVILAIWSLMLFNMSSFLDIGFGNLPKKETLLLQVWGRLNSGLLPSHARGIGNTLHNDQTCNIFCIDSAFFEPLNSISSKPFANILCPSSIQPVLGLSKSRRYFL